MAALNPPTTLRGVVDDNAYAGLLTDALEHVPDMTWPLSVPVFAQMRRDPQMAALLKAHILLVLRARWQVDGTGCRPEATQMVADDTGLPVAGRDIPGPARVRGVSWREHMRGALSSLTYGHAGFAMKADVSSGRARLVTLAERMQHTIGEIHADATTGEFLGVTQQLTPARLNGQPEIRARDMVWYCHEREGAGWYGTSLLRPAYGAWLIKREMQRVLATSNRRFGMGVPTVEWAAGMVPTPEQHAAALGAATAARVGDQSGLVLPPGARLVLAGMSGGTPDTLSFLKWLDQQISGMALARFMDLGDTSNGSRALGEAFIDFFQLAVQTIADDLADTATRQIAARIVGWNWGEDEPVPRITVSDVGTQEELTAEAMKALIDGGLLNADPGLKAWIRRKYRLPEAVEGSEPASVTRPATPPVGDDAGRVAAAAAPPPNVDAQGLAADHADTVEAITAGWAAASGPLVAALSAAVAAEVAGGALAGLAALAVPAVAVSSLAGVVTAGLLDAAERASRRAAIESAGVALVANQLDDDARGRIADLGRATTDLIVGGYQSAASRVALGLAGADGKQVKAAVTAALTDLSQPKTSGLVAGNVASAVSTAQGVGREEVFYRLPAGTTFRASEVNDSARCGPCREADGVTYPSLAAALKARPTGRHPKCEGRDRCRGFFYPITEEEA
jgi:hypothetical protein